MSLLLSRLNYVSINFPEIMPNIRSGSVSLNLIIRVPPAVARIAKDFLVSHLISHLVKPD